MKRQRNISLLLIMVLILSLVQIPVSAQVNNEDKDLNEVLDESADIEKDLKNDIKEKDKEDLNKSAKKSEGRIIYVDKDGNSNGDGKSWETAYNNIKDAISELNTSDKIDELWITKGEYELPSEGLSILKNIKIFGSLEGNETDIENIDSRDTILKGEIIVGSKDGSKPEFIELNNISISEAGLALEVYDANVLMDNVHLYDNSGIMEISNSTEDIKNVIEIKNSKINNNDELYLTLDNGKTDLDISNSEFKDMDDIFIEGLDIKIEDVEFDDVYELIIEVNDKKEGKINLENVDIVNGGRVSLDGNEDTILNINKLRYNNNDEEIYIDGFKKAIISNSEFKDNKGYSKVIGFGETETELKNVVFENNQNSLLSIHNSSRIEGLKIINNLYDEIDEMGLSINVNSIDESYYIKDILIENEGKLSGTSLINFHFNEKPEELVIEDIYINNTGERDEYISLMTIHAPEDMDKVSISNLHVNEGKDIKKGPIVSLNDNSNNGLELDLIQMNVYESDIKSLVELHGDIKLNIINSTIHSNTFGSLVDTQNNEWYETNPVQIKNSILFDNEIVSGYPNEDILDTKYTNNLVSNSKGSGANWDKGIGIDGGYNIDKDPLFLNERGQIDEKSPAIDKGNRDFVSWDKDIIGNTRVWGKNVDLGAFEYSKEVVELPEDPEDPEGGITIPPVTPEKPEEPEKPEDPDFPVLDKVNHFAYLEGYPDGTIRPEDNISREAVSAVFFRLLDIDYRETIRSESNSFKDVMADRWSNKHISTLTKGDILKGYENGEFRPSNSISRGELATIIKRFSNEKGTKKINFNDIEGHWAEASIKEAASQGWIEGYEDGSFRPDKYITRAEFTTLINRVLEREPKLRDMLENRKEFKDLDRWKWYYVAMIEATNGHKYETIDGKNVWTELKDFDIEM